MSVQVVLAMETAMNVFFNTGGEGNFRDKYWKGGVRPWFSLEITSLEGQVKFFIWTWKDSIKAIQNQLYAQYPNIEIVEVPDYALTFLYDKDKADIFGGEMALNKADAYPIKTYIDYGLDRDPKEEYKTDPITPIIEYMGSLGKGEQAWIQILIRAHKKEDKKKGKWFEKTDHWQDGVKEEIKKIIEGRKIKGSEESGQINLTPVEKDIITALERSVTKPGFDTGIRFIYLAETDFFSKANKGALGGVFAQFNANHLNGFKSVNKTEFDFKYQDPFGWRLAKKKREMFESYRLRSYFHPPHKRKHFVLNAEELATIYHFPGGVAQTPTFGRIESRKAEPPMNLPV